ncbi:hypothetical protein G6F50_017988 [Rhizopus delemar]|uniref:Uncharacterized protein n=1 Tax=Rhizopus delemar TaxID=936053 RepID=A0A9P6XNP3_9FUNG|nr:hypothetical protein G6F50_017988 [Rhizopus delemar]
MRTPASVKADMPNQCEHGGPGHQAAHHQIRQQPAPPRHVQAERRKDGDHAQAAQVDEEQMDLRWVRQSIVREFQTGGSQAAGDHDRGIEQAV